MLKEKKARVTICAITSTDLDFVRFCEKVKGSGHTYNDIFKAGIEAISKEKGIQYLES